MNQRSKNGNHVLPKYISRAEAARALRITPRTLDGLVNTQHLPVWQVPGHSRKWIDNAAVQKLAQQAAGAGDVA